MRIPEKSFDKSLTRGGTPACRGRLVAATLVLLFTLTSMAGLTALQPAEAEAAPSITATPITWPLVGIRSNVSNQKPGPDRFPIGTRFCNGAGATTAADVRTRFVLEGNGTGQASGFSVDSRSTETLGEIPAGECRDSYLNVVTEQSVSVKNHTREYYVEACNGACNSNTTTPSTNKYTQYPAANSTRVLYMAPLVNQNRNVTRKISGPGGCNFDFTTCDPPPSNLQVGSTYTFKLYAQTATGYDQVESFITFPAQIFQVLSAESTYSTPTGLMIDQPWANACGWNLDFDASGDTKCTGPIPQDYQPGGKAGRKVVTTYKVKVLGASTSAKLNSLIYDLSGGSFHYNADYGTGDGAIDYTSKFPLNTTVNGSGNVTSTSSPTQTSQVNCGISGSTCVVDYPNSTSVTLTASTANGSTFSGWSGACSGVSPTCTVSMTQARDVTATFTGNGAFPLTVAVNGTGRVTSSPAGIDCAAPSGSGCSTPVAQTSPATTVTLTASPGQGFNFSGWSGACSGSTVTCSVTMDQARNVQALFEPAPVVTRTLTVTDLPLNADGESIPPTGGRITSSSGGGGIDLDCGGTPVGYQCIGEYLNDTPVTVTATPLSGYKLVSWGGACSSVAVSGDGTGAQTCSVTMSQNRLVAATFVSTAVTTRYQLTTQTKLAGATPVSSVGTVTGNVAGTDTSSGGNPVNLSCSSPSTSNCSAYYLSGTLVTLSETPASGYRFTGWQDSSGNPFPCGGDVDPVTSTTCPVSVTAATTVQANFAAVQSGYLEVSIEGNGDGTVKVPDSGADIFCVTGDLGTCNKTFPINTPVTLKSTASSGSEFNSWGGACGGTGSTCDLTMSQARFATAKFDLIELRKLTVQKTGNGSGAIAATSGGNPVSELACDDNCSQSKEKEFRKGATVTLTVTPEPKTDPNPSRFAGWKTLEGNPSDACAGGASATSCEVTMSQARTVVADLIGIRPLDVEIRRIGDGNGSVTTTRTNWEDQKVECGAGIGTPDCSVDYDLDTSVTLTQQASEGSRFTGWSFTRTIASRSALDSRSTSGRAASDCGPSDATCTVTLDQARFVEASFESVKTLTLAKAGAGTGTVTSSPTGIDCASNCTDQQANFSTGGTVTLTATPTAGTSTFTGWSSTDPGFSCPGTGTCTVTMDQARTVTATFSLTPRSLTVTRDGNGTGTVTSAPAGINCGSTCSASFSHGTTVTLTATAATGSTFTGWSGAGCSGTGSCVVTMDQARSVTATFTLNTYPLNVSKAGTGSGSVDSAPAGIDCGSSCSATYNHGTTVTLTATAATGSTFTGWSGAGCSGTGTCVVSMTEARNVTATFTADPPPPGSFTLSVNKAGTGTGTVTSSPSGIDCGDDCNDNYTDGTLVTLTAVPTAGTSTFTGWSGAGCSGTGTCVVTMDQARSVTATFTLIPRTLTVTRDGNGSGTVSSDPAGIDCGSDCSESYGHGTTVTLTATAATGSTFTGWSNNCTVVAGKCEVTMSQARTVTATFTLNTYDLTVSKAGTGTGTVTSSPSGINCGGDCSEIYDHGTVVTLTATAATGSTFTGWSGAGCSGTGNCVVTMDQARAVTASLTLNTYALTVSKDGTGSGTVTSGDNPKTIDCGNDCSETYDHGTVVTLTASPATGSTFTGWSGAGCSGTGTCTVTMSQARAVTATFTADPPPPGSFTLSVNKGGGGTGSVTSSPTGIDCGNDCDHDYTDGTTVTLTATAATGSTFTGWSNNCTVVAGKCEVTMSQARTVTATFALNTYDLTVSKAGTGTGTVTSSPTGIDCGGDCSETYDHGTVVTLTAAAATDSTFTGWSGAGCSGTGTCVVTMSQARAVTATFTLKSYALTVSKDGTGSGTVTSSPSGIDCGGDCSETYDHGETVTLTASAATGSTFTAWSGAGCSGVGTCVVTMSQARAVTATFTADPAPPGSYTLSVNKAGNGSGTVNSDPTGIDCGNDCDHAYTDGTQVTLTASPSPGSTFAGWGGACAGIGTEPPSPAPWTCTVTVDQAKTVTATFTAEPPPPETRSLSFSKAGSGKGTVTSSPAGISCLPNCLTQSADFPAGSTVSVTASPSSRSSFRGWSGACSGRETTCEVTMDEASSLTASFTADEPPAKKARLRFEVKVSKRYLKPGQTTFQTLIARNTGKARSKATKINCRVCSQMVPVKVMGARRATETAKAGGGRRLSWMLGEIVPGGTRKVRVKLKVIRGPDRRVHCPASLLAANKPISRKMVWFKIRDSRPKRPPSVTG